MGRARSRAPENRPSLKPPLQKRSRESLESLLSAAEALLGDDLNFADLTVQAIVHRAGLSVGSFYARFESKSSLLPALQERAYERTKKSLERFCEDPRWVGTRLRERVTGLVDLMSRTKRIHRGLHRALLDYDLLTGDYEIGLARKRAKQIHSALVEFLLECRDEMTHEDPRCAVQTVLLFTNTSLNEKFVRTTGPYLAQWDPTRRQLSEELARAAYSYLTIESW